MKRNFVAITLVALFFSIALIGCEKENVNPKSKSVSELAPELQDLYKQMPQRDYGRISVIGDGILKFESIQQYEQVCEQLKQDCEMWEELFYNKYGKMSDEEIMDLEDEIGYDEFLPIKIFEESLDINGNMLFDTQRDAIQQWMDNEFKGENPTDHIFIFEWDQAVHNIYREVCVNDTIYQFREDATIMIPEKNLSEWLRIRRTPTKDLLGLEIVVVDNAKPDDGEQNNTKVQFPCYDYGVYDATTMPGTISGRDYSFWIVVGRVGICKDNRLESKLTNYKFHKFNKQGAIKYKKTKRNCRIDTFDQIFYKDHHRGWGSNSQYMGSDIDTIPGTMSTQISQKEAEDLEHSRIFWTSTPVHTIFSHFEYGVYQNPRLEIKIGNEYRTKNLVLKEGRYN